LRRRGGRRKQPFGQLARKLIFELLVAAGQDKLWLALQDADIYIAAVFQFNPDVG